MQYIYAVESKTTSVNTLSCILGLLSFISLSASLLFKEKWLWMDETTSITLLADPSFSHVLNAVVSALDAHPPLFFWVYWPIGQFVGLDTYVLKLVSISLFTGAVVVFFRFTTRLLADSLLSFVIFTGVISLTYLNYTLATQIRSYCLFFFVACCYFVTVQPLISEPLKGRRLMLYGLAGTGLIFVHNFGAIYIAASLFFFCLLFAWSKQRAYLGVLVVHLLVYAFWALLWFPSFQIQSLAGEPDSWIPKPTFTSFFTTVGELIPSLSAHLEHKSMSLLAVLRVCLVVGLFLYVAIPRLRQQGISAILVDPAFGFYVMAGCIAICVTGAAVIVSFGYMSVWLSRFQWPSELLLVYQLAYAGKLFLSNSAIVPRLARYIPAYTALLAGLMFYQSQKISLFPSNVLPYLADLNQNYPVFFESADYFLPIWHHKSANARYLLDWKTATATGNLKNAMVDYKILQSLRDKYNVAEIIPKTQFTSAHFPHFYVVDEASRYQFENLVANRQVRVVRVLPVAIKGHRLLECTFL